MSADGFIIPPTQSTVVPEAGEIQESPRGPLLSPRLREMISAKRNSRLAMENGDEDFISFNSKIVSQKEDKDNAKAVKKEDGEEKGEVSESSSSTDSDSCSSEKSFKSERSERPSKSEKKESPYTCLENPPWIKRSYSTYNLSVNLTEELVDFVKYMTPTKDEFMIRLDVIKRVSDLLHVLWPDAIIEIFGSFSTNLCLPNSDIDLGVFNIPDEGAAPLHAFASLLEERKFATQISVIDKAKVPIVKITDAFSNLEVDISFNTPNGVHNTAVIKEYVSVMPSLRPLVVFLKYFLRQRGLNDVYSGGLGSYGLILMAFNHIQMYYRKMHIFGIPVQYANLGILLISFFQAFGIDFNYFAAVVSTRFGGCYFNKLQKGWFDEKRPELLSIEDPQNPENDVTKGSFRIAQVKAAFEYAFGIITATGMMTINNPHKKYAPVNFAGKDPSILSKLVAMDPEIVEWRTKVPGLVENLQHKLTTLEECIDAIRPLQTPTPDSPLSSTDEPKVPAEQDKRFNSSSSASSSSSSSSEGDADGGEAEYYSLESEEDALGLEKKQQAEENSTCPKEEADSNKASKASSSEGRASNGDEEGKKENESEEKGSKSTQFRERKKKYNKKKKSYKARQTAVEGEKTEVQQRKKKSRKRIRSRAIEDGFNKVVMAKKMKQESRKRMRTKSLDSESINGSPVKKSRQNV